MRKKKRRLAKEKEEERDEKTIIKKKNIAYPPLQMLANQRSQLNVQRPFASLPGSAPLVGRV
jgi:hypothetical protein